MIFTKLKSDYGTLVSHMKDGGYSAYYVHQIELFCLMVIRENECRCWSSYEEAGEWFQNRNVASTMKDKYRTRMRIVSNFDAYGICPSLSVPDVRLHLHTRNYLRLQPAFKNIVDSYIGYLSRRGLEVSTIQSAVYTLSKFLSAMQDNGYDTIESIEEEFVQDYLLDDEGNVQRCLPWKLKYYFNDVREAGFSEFRRLCSFIPSGKMSRRNIDYLKEEEIEELRNRLLDPESGISLRNKAICLLFIYTGMRASDVAGLMLDSIDWKNLEIRTEQQKTSVVLHIHLPVIVGNAIYDYITKERGETESKYIFVNSYKNSQGLKSPTVAQIPGMVMKTQGFQRSRFGSHLFRHHLATRLLSEGTPLPVISETLGHTNPASVNSYLNADIDSLRRCTDCINIPALAAEVL